MRGLVRQVAVTLSALAMVGVNGWFSRTGRVSEVSDQYFNALTPADYTFIIWVPIFVGALALAAYQALPARRQDAPLDALGWPLVATYLATAGWPIAWQAEQLGLSLVLMVVMLLGLIAAYLGATHPPVVLGQPHRRAFGWLVRLPTALFFGWITAATIVNTTAWLVARGWTGLGLGPDLWAAALLLAAAGLGVGVLRRSGELTYGLVLIWAAWGVVAAHPGATATLVGAGVASAAVLLAAFLSRPAALPQRTT